MALTKADKRFMKIVKRGWGKGRREGDILARNREIRIHNRRLKAHGPKT